MAKLQILAGIAQTKQSADLGRNLRDIVEIVHMAAHAKVDLLCFPECSLTGYGPAWHEFSADFDPDAIQAAMDEVRDVARETCVNLVLGIHLPLEGGWSNSAVVIRSDGRIVGRYDKAHLYGRDAEFYRAGRAPAEVIRVKGMKLGVQICFDIRFPEPFRRLALGGAELILVPSHIHGKADMWKGDVIASHVVSRAAENGRFVLFANTAGTVQNVPSMIADPNGRIVSRCKRGAEQLLVAALDLKAVNDNFLRCRRKDLYD